MIDSHCHLADKKFTSDIEAVVQRAADVGVDRMIAIADSLPEAEDCIQLAEKYDQIYCTVGVHPHNSKEVKEWKSEEVKQLIQSSKKVVAIGEIGLDYHYMNSPKDVQQMVFKRQLELAKELNLPCVIHNRESIEDLKRIIYEVNPPQYVIHCCTEQWADVAELVEAGHLLSFTGIATYKHSDNIRDTIKQCPLEQMMIETDAPYLAPIPHRGKRNEPAFVVEVAKCIAEVKGISWQEVATITALNTIKFFKLPNTLGLGSHQM